MGKYFGTDGVRGIANVDLDCSLAYRIGQAAAMVLTEEKNGRAVFFIGKDTRISSDMLEAALISGVTSAGADVLPLGVVPTPAVAMLVSRRADAGIMISASHNPFEYNGIKLFNRDGFKLSDEIENRIEALIEQGVPHKTGADIGRVLREPDLTEQYIGSLIETASADVTALRVLFDCANGAASATAPAVFGKLGLKTCDFLSRDPDGLNINDHCGSTDLKALCKGVAEGGYDLGIAFDGDADRCLLVDETGKPLDGDIMLALLALEERRLGKLSKDTLVATVMSNFGLHAWSREAGVSLKCTAVGDRYVLEEMLEKGFSLGGENSGHVIFLTHSTTGDGQLTAVKALNLLGAAGKPLSELASSVRMYPQVLLNVPVRSEVKASLIRRAEVKQAIARAEEVLGSEGRVLVRPSGTENLVRVMLEGMDEEEIQRLAAEIAGVLAGL